MNPPPGASADFPAAHSMDSAWFAVDANGRVGLFDTGEAGALLTNTVVLMTPAESNDEAWAFLHRMWVERVAPGLTRVRDDLRDAVDVVQHGPYLLRVATPEYAQGLVDEGVVSRPDPDDETLLRTNGSFTPKHAEAALDPEVYVGSIILDADMIYEELELGAPVHKFHNDDYGVPGYYRRATVPERPVSLSELPEHMQGLVRLDVDFDAVTELQLADHVDGLNCQTWNNGSLRGGPPPTYDDGRPRAAVTIVALLLLLAVAALIWGGS